MDKTKKRSQRKKFIIILVFMLVFVIGIGFTFAWFTSQKTMEEQLRFGRIALDVTGSSIQEKNLVFNVDRKYITYQTGGKIMPGDTVSIDINVGLQQTSQDAYYVVKLTDDLNIFENAIYFADGTKDSGGNIVVYQTNGINTWVQGDATKTPVSKLVGKITKTERHPMSLKAKVSEEWTEHNATTIVKCDVLAIQQENLSEAQAQAKLIEYLPSGYMKVEKIVATNSASNGYNNGINTGVAWKDISKVDFAMQFTSSPAQKPMLLATYTSETTKSAPYIFVADTVSSGFVDVSGSKTSNCTKSELTNNGIKEFSVTINSNTQTGIVNFGCWSDSSWSASWELSRLVIYGTNGETLKNFVPCVRTSDGKVGLWEAVSGTFVSNSDTSKEFVAGDYVLPDDYAKVEFLQSDGTQWIDTGIKSTATLGFDMDVQILKAGIDQKFFGSYPYGVFLGTYSGKWRFGSSCNHTDVAESIEKSKITLKNGVWKFNGENASHTESAGSTNKNTIPVFGVKYDGNSITNWASIRLFGLKMFDGDVVTRNFFPCINLKTNQAGLYDMVERKFYANQGTGDDFVTSEGGIPQNYKQVEYLESSGIQSINTNVEISSSVTDFDVEMNVMWTNFSTRQLMGYSGTSAGYFGVNAGGYYEKGATTNSTVKASGSSYDYIVYSRHSGKDRFTVNGEQVSYRSSDTYSGNFRLYSLNGSYNCYMKLEYCTIKVGGTLVRDFVPCIRRSDNKPGLFDKVNKTFYVNEKTGADFTTNLISNEYQEISYIEATGSQHIITDYTPNQNTKIEIDIMPTTVATPMAFFCARDSMTTNTFTMFLLSGVFRADYNTKQNNITNATALTRYKISMQAGKVSINDDDYTIQSTSFTAGSPLRLLASHQTYSGGNYASLGNFAQAKMYSCKIYESGVLVRDFIPVFNTTTNKAGLFDKVTKQFFGNVGTGDFAFA